MRRSTRLLAIIGPGILVAATGVGAGDLATGALCGSLLGLTVLWAVAIGAIFKFALTEGLTRWQLASGSTVLEGAVRRFGRVVGWAFLVYVVLWSYFVGAALMSACGVAAHALVPILDAPGDKLLYGVAHSVAALLLVRLAGFRIFERLMSACIAVMFAVVVCTAVAVGPDWAEVAGGLLVPRITDVDGEGLRWTVALIGGVGGTVTILCYGYWIREEGRERPDRLAVCRLDLAVGYVVTGLFGLAMVVIGSRVEVEGGGAGLIVQLGVQLRDELGPLGPAARWAFLVGAWCAVFSSLLGVWQSVPYLFADLWRLLVDPRSADAVDLRASRPYRIFQIAIAAVPVLGMLGSFRQAQMLYAIVGALFVPLLALTLLLLNRTAAVGPLRNGVLATIILAAAIVFFLYAGWLSV